MKQLLNQEPNRLINKPYAVFKEVSLELIWYAFIYHSTRSFSIENLEPFDATQSFSCILLSVKCLLCGMRCTEGLKVRNAPGHNKNISSHCLQKQHVRPQCPSAHNL